ncbi:unnamed protein product [Symbiodinium sp. CCMP2592]|nr:unnamed protein product [Symbiodinium sp. CCMP2592]
MMISHGLQKKALSACQAWRLLSSIVVHGFCMLCSLIFALLRLAAGAEKCAGVEFLEGHVTHARSHEANHAFKYPVRMALVDLDSPPAWWSEEPVPRLSAKEAREALGVPSGRVRVLTTPSSAGYHQNPIQIYFCDNKTAQNQGICEVSSFSEQAESLKEGASPSMYGCSDTTRRSILECGESSRLHSFMLVSLWHAGPLPSHLQCPPGRVSGWTAHSQFSAIWAYGVFVVGFALPNQRKSQAGRLARKASVREDTVFKARPESMLDRLQDHAAALGGKCLAIGYKSRMTKVPWQCQHGHTWDARPKNVLNKQSWCPECARNKQRIPLQRLQDHAKARGGRCLSTSKYNRSRGKVTWQCKLGHTWEATVNKVVHCGTWCPKCSRKGRTCKKRSLKDLQEHAASLGGRCLATTYEGMLAPVLWRCHKGHVWSARPSNILHHKTWCPACAGNALLDVGYLHKHAIRRGGECLATEYVNNQSAVTWKCEHGHIWQARPHDVLNKGSWCPHCRKIGLTRLRAHAASLGGRCCAKSYRNSSEHLLWECKLGHRWEASASNVLHGNSWCPRCAASTWRTEAEIRSILETIFHPAKFPSRYPPFLKGLQLDGYCLDLQFGFEYQGEQHYDPENYFHFGDSSSFRSQQERDARKMELCKQEGVRLLIVPCFVKDKRTFVLTALLQWFAWAQITPTSLVSRGCS